MDGNAGVIVLAVLVLIVTLAMTLMVAWNVSTWPGITAVRSGQRRTVSVLIPARDESATIDDCLARVASQGAIVREILVYDDRSADDTAARVAGWSARNGRVRLLRGGPLPPGWCGKTHACQRLSEAATGEWLLFLDADARLLPDAIARLVADAETRQLTLLSPWPRLEMVSFWERLLMPVLNLVVFSLFPARLSLSRQDASLGLAHGACMLVHRETYRRVGGHASVRDQLFEDSRLAQAWRAAGERSLCLDGESIVSVRMYAALDEIWRGFQKNFYPAFAHDASFWAFLVLHATAFIVPLLLVVTAPAIGITAVACGILARLLLATRFEHSFWSAFLQPVAAGAMIALGLSSRARYRARTGVEWKGRRYGRHGEVQ